MARKIISKGSGNSSTSTKRNGRGSSTLDGLSPNSNERTLNTNKRHHHASGVLDSNKRPFKSETNIFSSSAVSHQPSLHPLGERQLSLENNHRNTLINANNGFIPIHLHHDQEHLIYGIHQSSFLYSSYILVKLGHD